MSFYRNSHIFFFNLHKEVALHLEVLDVQLGLHSLNYSMPIAYRQALSRACIVCKQHRGRECFGKLQYERFAEPTCVDCVEQKRRKTGKLYGTEQTPNAIDVFDSAAGAIAYSTKPHIRHTQLEMSERALELLGVPRQRGSKLVILDIGCGNGISSEVVQRWGHECIGTDISLALLKLAHKDIELSCQDICEGTYLFI